MLRFVILHHTNWPGHPDHYDLMLQFAEGSSDDDAVLKTFSTLADSFLQDGSALKLIRNHRRAYLTFEGELSGNRGRVARVDTGDLAWRAPSEFGVFGAKLRGEFHIESAKGVYKLVAE